jgi:hypothetical protein
MLAFVASLGALAAGVGVIAVEYGRVGPAGGTLISALGTFVPCLLALELGRRSLARGAEAVRLRRREGGDGERTTRADAGAIVVDE